MSDFIYFILGTTLGGMFGVACMCVLQINRLSEVMKSYTLCKVNDSY